MTTTATQVPSQATQSFRIARDFLLEHRDDYQTAYSGFQWPRPKHFNWALDWFHVIATGEHGKQTALWVAYEDGREAKFTFRQLSDNSARIANYLRGLGMKRGDRVLLMLGNIPPLWETMLAVMKLGAVIVPATTLLTADDFRDRISRGRVRHIVCAAEQAPKLAEVAQKCTRISVGGGVKGWEKFEEGYSASPDFAPDGETLAGDPMQLYFTSGTTSKPKLVMHSHTSYPVGHLSTMYWIGIGPDDIHCNLSSPGWAKHAWSCFFAPWNAEATVFVLNQARFNARNLLDTLTRCGVTTFCAPPTVWRMLVTEKLSEWKVQLREAASAGEPLNPEVIEQVQRAWGLTIRDGYGQTETTAQVGNSPGQKLKIGAMGRPMPGYRVRLLDPEGKDAEEGELCLPLDPPPVGLMAGYQDDHGTVIPLTGEVYRTGDVVHRDADGYLTFVGRADDVFKASDYRISPFEVESALIEHPDVMECAVVPSPDPVRTALVKAFVSLRAGAQPSRDLALSIFQHSRKVLAPYKRVRRLEFFDLPKTISGKIRRVELRTAEAKRPPGARPQNEFREEDFPELAS
ncbi:MAG TPA: AMP-binding protein [Terriglobales bacterium]|nr:AMP-binding protein [Terriglobales bacterium]